MKKQMKRVKTTMKIDKSGRSVEEKKTFNASLVYTYKKRKTPECWRNDSEIESR